jgi:hypothetical protein
MSSNVATSEFGGFFGHIGHLLSNAAKSAGHAIGKAEHSVASGVGTVTHAVTKIPIVGAPLKTIYSASYHVVTGPARLVSDIAHGKRIDKAVLSRLSESVKDAKAVAPYAQAVVSLVPGVGTGVSGVLGAGLALANGQRIDHAILEGVSSSLPGGPLAKAALHAAVDGIHAAATGAKFDIEAVSKSALGSVLPPAAMGGIDMVAKLAHGQPLDKALTESTVNLLPVDASVKSALHTVSQVSIDLAHGKKVDAALLAQVKSAVPHLPIDSTLKTQLMTVATTGKDLMPGHAEQALSNVLHSAVAEAVLHTSTKNLHPDVKKALQTGLALGTAAAHQSHVVEQLASPTVVNKLVESGIQAGKAEPAIAAARKLVGAGTRGFDLGIGVTNSKSNLFSISHLREQLSGPDKMGFDMALAAKVGLVTQPIPKGMSAAAVAGHAVTHGMQGSDPTNKQAMMAAVQASPSASVGAAQAVKGITATREGFIHRVLKALHVVR